MVRETRKEISRMLEIIRELEIPRGSYNIGGSATAAAFGRGGVPPEVKIFNYAGQKGMPDISGVAAQVGFGRGGTPKETRIVLYKSQETPNITGSAAGVGLGRGGIPKETGYISYKTQEEESDERRC